MGEALRGMEVTRPPHPRWAKPSVGSQAPCEEPRGEWAGGTEPRAVSEESSPPQAAAARIRGARGGALRGGGGVSFKIACSAWPRGQRRGDGSGGPGPGTKRRRRVELHVAVFRHCRDGQEATRSNALRPAASLSIGFTITRKWPNAGHKTPTNHQLE